MTNLEIDCKLAEAMDYKILAALPLVIIKEKPYLTARQWSPHLYMGDAWEVAKRLGLCEIRREENPYAWVAVFTDGFEEDQLHQSFSSRDKSAPMAICKAALKVVEGGNSDE
jgi:hypothetical protein